MSIIFNLDQTIIDSQLAKEFIEKRQWNKVFPLISQFYMYDHILETLTFLSNKDVEMALISSNTSHYCRRVLYTFKIPLKYISGFYDAPNSKERIEQVNSFRYTPTYFVSNLSQDIIISKQKFKTIGCGWGNNDNNELLASNPDYFFKDTLEFSTFIKSIYENYPKEFYDEDCLN